MTIVDGCIICHSYNSANTCICIIGNIGNNCQIAYVGIIIRVAEDAVLNQVALNDMSVAVEVSAKFIF